MSSDNKLKEVALLILQKQYDSVPQRLLDYYSQTTTISSSEFKRLVDFFLIKVVQNELLKCDIENQISSQDAESALAQLNIILKQPATADQCRQVLNYNLALLPHMNCFGQLDRFGQIAECYQTLGKFKMSGICFLVLMTISDRVAKTPRLQLNTIVYNEVQKFRSWSRRGIAQYYLVPENYLSVIMWAKEAFTIADQLNDVFGLANSNSLIATAYMQMGECLKSIEIIEKTLQLLDGNTAAASDMISNMDTKGVMFRLLGENLLKLGDYCKAGTLYEA